MNHPILTLCLVLLSLSIPTLPGRAQNTLSSDSSASAPSDATQASDTSQPDGVSATADSVVIASKTDPATQDSLQQTPRATSASTVNPEVSILPVPGDSAQADSVNSEIATISDTTAIGSDSTAEQSAAIPASSGDTSAADSLDASVQATTIAKDDTAEVPIMFAESEKTLEKRRSLDSLRQILQALKEPAHTPFIAEIVTPAHLRTITNGVEVFRAFTAGSQAHFLKDSAFVWSSSVDGEIRRGPIAIVSDLSIGPHILTLTVTPLTGSAHRDTVIVLVQDRLITRQPQESEAQAVTFPEDSVLGLITMALRMDSSGTVQELMTLRNTTGSQAHQEAAERSNRETEYRSGQRQGIPTDSWSLKEYVFEEKGIFEEITFRTMTAVTFSGTGGPAGLLGGGGIQRRSRGDGSTIFTEVGEWMSGLPEIVVPGSPRIAIEVPRGFFGGGQPVFGTIRAVVRITPFGFVRDLIVLELEMARDEWVQQDFLRMFRETLFSPLLEESPYDRIAYCEFEALGDHFVERRGRTIRGWQQEFPVEFIRTTQGSLPTLIEDAQEKGVIGFFFVVASVDARGRIKSEKKLFENPKDKTGLRGRFLSALGKMAYAPATVGVIENEERIRKPATTYMFFPYGFQIPTFDSETQLRKHYNDGVTKLLERNYEGAIEKFQRVLELDLNNDYLDTYQKLAWCYSLVKDKKHRYTPEDAYRYGMRRLAVYNNLDHFPELLEDFRHMQESLKNGEPLEEALPNFNREMYRLSSMVPPRDRPALTLDLDSLLAGITMPSEIALDQIAGEVLVGAYIGKNGKVNKVHLLHPAGIESLDKLTLDLVKDLKFTPAMFDSEYVEHWTQIAIPFGDPASFPIDSSLLDLGETPGAPTAVDSLSLAVSDSAQPALPDSAMLVLSDSSTVDFPDSLRAAQMDSLVETVPDMPLPPTLPKPLYRHGELLPSSLQYTAGYIETGIRIDAQGVVSEIVIIHNAMEGDRTGLENALARQLFGTIFDPAPDREHTAYVTIFEVKKDRFEPSSLRSPDTHPDDVVFPQPTKLEAPQFTGTGAETIFSGLFQTLYRIESGMGKQPLPIIEPSVLSDNARALCNRWFDGMTLSPGSIRNQDLVSFINFRSTFNSDPTGAMLRMVAAYVRGYKELVKENYKEARKYLQEAADWDILGRHPEIISQIAYTYVQQGVTHEIVQSYGRHMRRLAYAEQEGAAGALREALQILRLSVRDRKNFLVELRKHTRRDARAVVTFLKEQNTPQIIGGVMALGSAIKYPEDYGDRKRGAVEVAALIAEDGKVKETAVLRSLGSRNYDKAAVEAVKKVKYEPAVIASQTIDYWVTIPVPF